MVSRAPHPNNILVRMRNYLLFFLLCIAVSLGTIGLGFMFKGDEAFVRWGGLTFFTLCLLGLFVGDSEKFLRKARFWVVTAIFFAGHLAVFSIVLTHAEEWKVMWFTIMAIEYPPLLFLRDKFVVPSPKS